PPATATLFPYTTLFRSVRAIESGEPRRARKEAVRRDRAGVRDPFQAVVAGGLEHVDGADHVGLGAGHGVGLAERHLERGEMDDGDRKSTRLNSSHVKIS